MGSGGYRQVITCCPCHNSETRVLLLQCGVPPTADSPPWTSTICYLSPSHRKQFSTNATGWITFHRGSFRNSPLQHGFPTESQILLGKLLQYGFLSSWVCRSQHGLPMGSPFPFMHPPAPVWIFSMDYRWTFASWWSSMGCRGTSVSSWSSPWDAGKSLLQSLEHLLSPCTDLAVCWVVPLPYSHFSLFWLPLHLCNNFFFTFLSVLSQRPYHHWWHIHPGAVWHWLCWTWRKLLTSSHRSDLCSLSATKTWLCEPNRADQ